MLSDEDMKALEQARSNITRGNDIESAMLILEKCALEGVIFTGGRLNIFKIAVRQILNFLEEYKDKGYLDVVREKVKANETVEKQTKEIEELKEKNKDLDEQNFKYTIKIASLQTDIQETTKLINKNWKDKIKAKIEELEYQKRQWIEDRDNKHKDSEIIYAIEVLQSLLEKE